MADAVDHQLDLHFANIADTALADLRTLAINGGGMGVFFLGSPIIDALARASSSSRQPWKAFVTEYMPAIDSLRSYERLADVLYREFRNPGAHNLSASARFRFTSGDANRGLHLTDVNDVWYLHAGLFAEDVETAFNALWERARTNAELRDKVLAWFDDHPPVGPVRPATQTSGGKPVAEAPAVSAADHGAR